MKKLIPFRNSNMELLNERLKDSEEKIPARINKLRNETNR
jgi:hypothetical protein